jgi:hypothetical protein
VLLRREKAGLVKLGHVALDGTQVKANASKHKAMSYGRMPERATELEAEVAKRCAPSGLLSVPPTIFSSPPTAGFCPQHCDRPSRWAE